MLFPNMRFGCWWWDGNRGQTDLNKDFKAVGEISNACKNKRKAG